MQPQPAHAADLAGLEPSEVRRLIRAKLAARAISPAEAHALLKYWPLWRRKNQIWPAHKVRGVVNTAGRGGGKTRWGSEESLHRARGGEEGIILIGRTLDEVRQVMIDGPSGLRACCRPGESVDIAINSTVGHIMPYGTVIYLRSDMEPDKIRGINAAFAWLDEAASYRHADEVLSNTEFAVRLGRAQWMITTTPRPTKFVKALVARPDVHCVGGSMYENQEFLAESFIASVERIYGGTALFDQEAKGLIVDHVDGALWQSGWIEPYRVAENTRGFGTVVVSFDPSASNATNADEHGVLLCASGAGAMSKHLYVIDDLSGRMTVDAAAELAVDTAIAWNCDVVYEGNNGGEWIRLTLKAVLAQRQLSAKESGAKTPRVEFHDVTAKASKEDRAKPVTLDYKAGMCHHLGVLPDLETQMTGWVPSRRNVEGQERSPGRIDALVWAWYWLISAKGDKDPWSAIKQLTQQAHHPSPPPRY